jgi:pilus assembly protein CpaB
MLFGAAWLSAAALSWFLYAKTKAPKEEKKITVMAAARDMPLGTLIKKTDLRPVQLLVKDVPRGAVFTEREALSRVLLYPTSTNETLLQSRLSGTTTAEGIASTIEPGYRAVAVPITDTTGVAGLLQPGSRVDVLFTRPGSMAEAITTTVLQNVRVLSVGRMTTVAPPVTTTSETKATQQQKAQVVTLVLNPADAQKVELAKSQGRLSLALRNPLDLNAEMQTAPITTDALDPMVSVRNVRARKLGRTTSVAKANLDDPKVWQELTGEKKWVDPEALRAKAEEEARKKREAEKPRTVVDVFRGDKHVVESFK